LVQQPNEVIAAALPLVRDDGRLFGQGARLCSLNKSLMLIHGSAEAQPFEYRFDSGNETGKS